MAIAQGTRLGKYEIRSLLGAGGMGEVYLAQDLTLHRPVAIKLLSADFTMDQDRLKRFELEAFATSSLNQPNILTIYEIGHERGHHFIVTEFVDGESLGQQLRLGAFELSKALEIGIQIAAALAATHAAGIVHRDIKPDNVMLRRDHLIKVLDFGLAKLREQEIAVVDIDVITTAFALTAPGIVMGTARYMSPEQARGLPVDARTDIWSLGVVLYEMVAGHLPFTGKTMSDVIAAVLEEEPPSLNEYSPDVPNELQRIVTKALCKDKEERYQAVKDLELDLKALKQRSEFEAELRRSGKWNRDSEANTGGMRIQPASHRTAPNSGLPTNGDPAYVSHKASNASYTVSAIKRHKGRVLLVFATITALTIAGAYFGYARWDDGHKTAITSLAVLPFTNTSKDREQEFLSDGLSESLINRLSELPGVKVIANSSSSKYKGKDADLRDVAYALDVAALLTGRVSQRGDNLSISVELINASDRTELWGEQYNRKATDLLAVQADISREIAEKLRLQLTPRQQQQVAKREKVNAQAYELLLKGRFYRSRGGAEDRKKAAEYFNQALTVDPVYALAYAELSITYWSLVSSSTLNPKEYSPKAEALARKALELDENLAEGYYALGNLKTDAWEWAEAEANYKRAIELNPNLALAHRWYANFLTLMGRHEQAIAEIKRARQLDPLSLPVNAIVGYTFYEARQYDQAIEALTKTLELDQNFPYAHLFRGYTYAAKGMYPEAIAEYQEAIRLGHDTPSRQVFLGAAYAQAGDRERARTILKQLQTTKEYVSAGELAVLLAALGERDKAFASLEKAFEGHDLQLQYLGVSPTFDPLRSDPRFQDLVRRVGLTP